jgi:ankyrin repeat protein/GNAT superfamily N-acetyltransferase
VARIAAAGSARLAAGAPEPRLSDAQLAVARGLGAASWPALVHRAEAEAVAREARARRLVEAATAGRLERARALADLLPEAARLPLDAALVLGDTAALRAALDADAALAERPLGARGWLPLLYVTHSVFLGTERTDGLLASAEALLAAGADPNASFDEPERGPQSALSGAAGKAHEPRATALLLAAGANPDDDESLYHAVAAPDTRCLRLLLEAGATVARTNALPNALGRRDPETVRLLLEHLPADHHERRWALQWAVAADESPKVVRLLVEHGADLEARDEGADRTPYGLALRMGRRDLAALLAELGAERRVGPVDALIGAAFAGDRAEAVCLAAGDEGTVALVRTAYAAALPQAAGLPRPAAVRILLELGVPVDSRGELGGTALHHAAWMGAAGLVAELLAAGANPERRDTHFGLTPLGWVVRGARNAAPGDHLEAAQALARAGARIPPELATEAEGDLADSLAGAAGGAEGADAAGATGRATAGGADAAGATGRATAGATRAVPDEPDYAELEWRADAAHLRLLAASPAAAVRAVGDGVAVRIGLESHAENGVVCSRFHGDLDELIAWLDAPAQWLLTPPTDPPDLLARLVSAGAIAERTAVVMGAEIGSVPPPGVVPTEIAIVPVRDRARLEAWMDIAEACRFVDPGAQRALWAEVLAGFGPGGPLQLRLAVRDGAPVGMAAFLLDGDNVSLRHLAVLPAERRSGVGQALGAHLAAEARRAGARTATLSPTPESIPVYRGWGFVLRPAVRDRVLYLPWRRP